MMGDSGGLQQAKLVLLGDMGAGKSSLVLRFVKGKFFDYQVSTWQGVNLTCIDTNCSRSFALLLSPSRQADGQLLFQGFCGL